MKKIAVFASGEGSNALNLIRYFQEQGAAAVVSVVTNNPQAGIIQRLNGTGIPVTICTRAEFQSPAFIDSLQKQKIDLIVLAGFLWLLPPGLVQAYSNRIVNIHPSLLPKFGGKGMYGMHVHEAVVAAAEKESGITIHLVNEQYDKGEILLQEKCVLEVGETPQTLSQKIRQLEHRHFPPLVEQVLKRLS
jgi:phosphoribosylglycinamide formyltransferase-1